ncbi:MAG: isoprenylcysteine carboxylmethyltransferase family protein [Synergistaceae bacterium]|nr:isoprenylcysteine carboxylmethyltransferase family protein [Synergistaceae bacterium]
MSSLVFKYRGLLWGVFALAILFLPVSGSPLRFAVSVPLLAAGQALRFWAAGVIPKYRTLVVDAPVLVTHGPYAAIRNPLYAGNAIMGFGWSLMAGWPWVLAFAAAFSVVYSMIIIPWEERFLLQKFGESYAAYKKATPSLIPSITTAAASVRKFRGGFDAGKSWAMERHSLRMNTTLTALVLARLLWAFWTG